MSLITTTLKGGFLVLLPLLLFIMMLTKIIELFIGLATPLADLFPAGIFDDPQYPVALAIILLLGASFFIGLAMKSQMATRLGKWFEEKTFGRLPIYKFVKSLIDSFLGPEDDRVFKPALFDTGGGQSEFCYIVEDHGDGDLTIMVPWAPTAFSGSVKIVPKSLVTPIESTLGDASMVLSHLGIGACQLIKQKAPQASIEVLNATNRNGG